MIFYFYVFKIKISSISNHILNRFGQFWTFYTMFYWTCAKFPAQGVIFMSKIVVADGWAGAENLKKQLRDGWTDRRTDRWTDQKVAYGVACPRLKTETASQKPGHEPQIIFLTSTPDFLRFFALFFVCLSVCLSIWPYRCLICNCWLFSRVLRDSISHFSVGPSVCRSVGWSVRRKTVLKTF